jgi:hypothetical protein
MKANRIFLINLVFFGLTLVHVQAQKSAKPTLFLGATAHIGNGTTIQNSVVSVVGNKFDRVSDASNMNINPADFDTIIQLTGKHIYPGYIALNSMIGLTEVDAIRATHDYAETGEFNPNVRALTAFNTDSKLIPTLRSNGVLTVQATPQRGWISGTSSVFRLTGWNWEDAVCKKDDGIHVHWPESSMPRTNGDTSRSIITKNNETIQKIKTLFLNAQAYSKEEKHSERDIKLNAMSGLFSEKQTLYIHTEHARDITDAVQFAAGLLIKKLVIVGGSDSWMVLDVLLKYQVGIVLPRLHQLPGRPDDPVDQPFKLPKLLSDAGLVVALSNTGGMEAGTRNLGFTAGTAAAYGMNKEEALQLITLNPAILLGINKTDGSIEEGKNATFFVSSGDALDMRTSAVDLALIDGKPVNLDNPQKELYRRYMNKYGLPTN